MDRCEQLRTYVESHESEITARWTTIYRQLYEEDGTLVPEDRLIEAVTAALQELERSGPRSLVSFGADAQSAHLIKQVCLAGFECHGRLIPDSEWADQRVRQEVREQLRRRLFCLAKDLVD
jgi:hypothetical protein